MVMMVRMVGMVMTDLPRDLCCVGHCHVYVLIRSQRFVGAVPTCYQPISEDLSASAPLDEGWVLQRDLPPFVR